MAPGPVPKKIYPKPFLVGHMGPNLRFHTPFTPLPDTFLVIFVKRMTLKKNLPPPLNRVKACGSAQKQIFDLKSIWLSNNLSLHTTFTPL